MGEMRYCENCGTPLVPGMRFCENCGKQILWNEQKRGQRRISEGTENRMTAGMQPYEKRRKVTPPAEAGRSQNGSQVPIDERDQGGSHTATGRRGQSSQGFPENQNRNGAAESRRSQLANPYVRETGTQEHRERYRQERLGQDWEQSWERRTEPENAGGMTAAQYVLIGVIVVMLAALLAMGGFWMLGRSGRDSSAGRSNTPVSAADDHSSDAVPAGEDAQTENPIVILTP